MKNVNDIQILNIHALAAIDMATQGKRKHRHPVTLQEIYFHHKEMFVTSYDLMESYRCHVDVVSIFENVTKSSDFMHSHDYFEVMIILHGTCDMAIENSIYHCIAGNVFFFNRNIKHAELYSAHAECRAAYLCLEKDFFINYPREFDPLFKHGEQLGRFVHANLEEKQVNKKDYMVFEPLSNTALTFSLINEIKLALSEKKPFTKIMVYAKIAQIICTLEDETLYKHSYIDLGNFPDLKLAEDIRKIIDENHGNISRSQIAEALNYTPEHAYRIFKKIYGISVKGYCQLLQMRLACQLLEQTDDSIASIIMQVGYTNKTQFYKVFQSVYGCTPLEFREKNIPLNL